jgi:hypothetical protein
LSDFISVLAVFASATAVDFAVLASGFAAGVFDAVAVGDVAAAFGAATADCPGLDCSLFPGIVAGFAWAVGLRAAAGGEPGTGFELAAAFELGAACDLTFAAAFGVAGLVTGLAAPALTGVVVCVDFGSVAPCCAVTTMPAARNSTEIPKMNRVRGMSSSPSIQTGNLLSRAKASCIPTRKTG